MESKLVRMEANYKAEIDKLVAVSQRQAAGEEGAVQVLEWWEPCVWCSSRWSASGEGCASTEAKCGMWRAMRCVCAQGGAVAAAGASLEVVREKDAKINELIEELGGKEMLLSEAQAQLAKVGGRVADVGCVGGMFGSFCQQRNGSPVCCIDQT